VIVAGLIFYRCGAEPLDRMLRSLEDHGVDGLVAVDGPFAGVSKDVKTIREEWEALRSFRGKKALISPQVWASEPVKRNVANRFAYEHIVGAKGGHHLLGIDSDEELLSDIDVPAPGKLGVAKLYLPERDDLDKFGERAVLHIRLHELSRGLTWGPSHFEMTSHGIRYSMPHCVLGSSEHQLEIMHHPQDKPAGQLEYNEGRRLRVEAGLDYSADTAIPTWPYASSSETINVHMPGLEVPGSERAERVALESRRKRDARR
jgi:hypothetical protein